uniref:Holliday junction recognition protein n=1 Tax=Cavia porcellus TaxID=10141 RepID=H0V4F5_CAVPO|nr:Holliday junction recognition protein isoform X1 [Cavia porcellus]
MEVQALQGECPKEDTLVLKLRETRRRFQRRMQQLIAKYEHPFEDDPLVHMSTLTYKTPKGLRFWGGRLITETNQGQIQDALGNQGDEPLHPHSRVWGTDSGSSDTEVAASDQEDPSACALAPAVPQSPLKDDLRRKYLTQVDILLLGVEDFEGIEKGVRKDTTRTLGPSTASPAIPAPGSSSDDSTESLGSPVQPASSSTAGGPLYPCPADLTVVPRSNSPWFLETSSYSCLSSQSFKAADVCNATISDLYAGMLHSMSRLLSMKPACVISTKTFTMRHWGSRRRRPHRSWAQMNRTFSIGARHSRRHAKRRPYPEPQGERQTLRDCKNFLHKARHKKGVKLEKPLLEENKPQLPELDPSRKELPVVPRKSSSLTYLGNSARLDREKRLMTLKWLISPVKMVSQPRMLQGHAETRYSEIETRFNRLHRECCLSPRKHPRAAGCLDALDVYRSGCVSPGSPQALEAHRLRFPFSRAYPKSLSETFEHLDKRWVKVSRCPPKDSLASCSQSHLPQNTCISAPTSNLFQGHNAGALRKAASPSQAISAPGTDPLSRPKSSYAEIKARFDQLHQRILQMSPQQAKVPSHVGMCGNKASMGVWCQTGDSFRKLNLDPGFQGLTRSPWGSVTVEAHVSAGTAMKDPPDPAKRRRLWEPMVCGLQTWRTGHPIPAQLGRKSYASVCRPAQEKEEHNLQDKREK